MNYMGEVDLDKLVSHLCLAMWFPLRQWFHGVYLWEPIYLEHFFVFNRKRRLDLDIGLRRKIQFTMFLHNLHRQAPNQSDVYGSDFALTIDMAGTERWTKTALFQLKVSQDQKVTLEKEQLGAALMKDLIAQRSFVAAIDRRRCTQRIAKTEDILAAERHNSRKTFTVDAVSWLASSDWVFRWIRCEHGVLSDEQHGGLATEELLNAYVAQDERNPYFGVARETPESPESLGITARTWYIARINLG
jgi:hypothetical protein